MGKSDWRPFVYGGVCSCIAEFGTFPIDTTKTRLQIQGGRQDGQVISTRYRGMLHAMCRISNEEGIRALYQGIAPAVLRQATYGTIKFGLYYSLKQTYYPNPQDETLFGNITCGATAGMVSSAIANPTDVLKVRLQSGRHELRNSTLFNAFVSIYQKEGLAGLWRGVVPTSQRAAVIVGVELSIYDACKRYFISNDLLKDGSMNHLLSSFISSLGGALASTPIDVVKTRLMNQCALLETGGKIQIAGSPVHAVSLKNVYCGTVDCFLKTITQEGPSALYKGFIPTWFRLGPWNIIFFVTFEQMKKLY